MRPTFFSYHLFLSYFRITYSLGTTRCFPKWDCIALMHTMSYPSTLSKLVPIYAAWWTGTQDQLVAWPELSVRKSVVSRLEPGPNGSEAKPLTTRPNMPSAYSFMHPMVSILREISRHLNLNWPSDSARKLSRTRSGECKNHLKVRNLWTIE